MNSKTALFIPLFCILILASCGKDDDNTNVTPAPTTSMTLKDDIENQEYVQIIEDNISDLPQNVQVSMALIENGMTEYIGIHKNEGVLRSIDNSDNIFEIGSITKVFTSICLSKMSIDGEATLEETLQSQFDFPLKAGGDISLQQLVNHTSGLSNLPTNVDEVVGLDINDPYATYTEENLESYLKNHVVLNSASGTEYEYSNLGMGTLGFILSKKRGTSYEELLQDLIFEPLQMTNSTTLLANVDASKLIPGRDENGDLVPNWNFLDVFSGAGSIKSSILDLEKFVHKNFEDDAVYNLPQESTFEIGSEGLSIGMGWHILESDGFRVLTHNGGTGGYSSYLAIDKKNRKAVIILSSVTGLGAYDKIDDLGNALMENISL